MISFIIPNYRFFPYKKCDRDLYRAPAPNKSQIIFIGCPAPPLHEVHQKPDLSAIRWSRLFASPINVFTVSHFDYPNCKLIVLDRVDDAIPSLTESIPFLTCQLFATPWPWVFSQSFNTLEDLLQIFLGYCGEIFLNRCFEMDLIYGHLSLAF